jgi:hypothetical protein
MRKVKLLGVALISALALGAVMVALASAALPEFVGPFPNHFTVKQLGIGLVETVGKRTIKCTGSLASGDITGPKDILISSIISTGCASTSFGAGKCQSGATQGEIKSLGVLGLLGYITISTKLVGLLFEPDGGINHLASFECETLIGAEKLIVKGTVICDLNLINVRTAKYHLFCNQEKGIQKPLGFEGTGTVDTLLMEGRGPENFLFEQFGVKALSDVLTVLETEILA